MNFKKLVGFLHLWLGIISGLLVFIIAITGCIYAFEAEIQNVTEEYRFVTPEKKAFLLPSEISKIATDALPGKHIHAVMYKGADHAAHAIFYSDVEEYYYVAYINPYNGKVQHIKDMDKGFFPFILDGHFYLWLPHEIGQPVVAIATLVFVVMMISGIYLWWKRKGASSQKFKIKWDGKWRRKNYDLHNVLGFYVLAIAIIFAVTGLVWGFEWFSKLYYKSLSGGKELTMYYEPLSDTTKINKANTPAIDKVWYKMIKEYPSAEAIEIHIPDTKASAIGANANPDASTYYKTDFRYFDQYTLKEIEVNHIYGRASKNTTADNIMRMNYDIHTGAVLGLSGKILAFFASLVVASLPVTGVIIWWGRKKKEKKKSAKKISKKQPALAI